jgi:hypothetical protein
MTVKRKAAARPTLVSIAVPHAEGATTTIKLSGRIVEQSPQADGCVNDGE